MYILHISNYVSKISVQRENIGEVTQGLKHIADEDKNCCKKSSK